MPRPLPALTLGSSLAAACTALLLLGTGCHSHNQPDQFAEAVAMGERSVSMEGNATYFDGNLAVKVTVSRGVGKGEPVGGRHHGGGGEGGPPSSDASDMDQDSQMAYLRARGALGSPLPPVTIRLQLENKGKNIINVDVTEMNSDLGNFAVDPELLSLAPGQTAEPYPMISQLGITSDVIPVKVTLRMGGKVESQTIPVQNLKASPQGP